MSLTNRPASHYPAAQRISHRLCSTLPFADSASFFHPRPSLQAVGGDSHTRREERGKYMLTHPTFSNSTSGMFVARDLEEGQSRLRFEKVILFTQ